MAFLYHLFADTVTILSSEDEDETRFPATKHQRLENEARLSRKRKMEDEVSSYTS